MSHGSFEAINYALRKSKDGVIVSFVVHPNDVDQALTALPIGAIVNIEWSEADDKPKEPATTSPQSAGGHARAEALTPERRSEIATQAAETRWKPKRKFSELSPTEQAGIRCNDAEFNRFLAETYPIHVGNASQTVRRLCGVTSRADFAIDEEATILWGELNRHYESWLLAQRYPEAARR